MGCCHIKVPYAFIQPNGSWCWSNAGFMASLKGQGAGGITWLVISLGIRTIFLGTPIFVFCFQCEFEDQNQSGFQSSNLFDVRFDNVSS